MYIYIYILYVQVYIHLSSIHHLIYFHRNTGALISVSLVTGWSWERGESPLSLATSNELKLLNRQEGLY